VECIYQASKVFRDAGPFLDLLDSSPTAAKRDHRLRSSGPLVAFEYQGARCPLTPVSAYYDWLYGMALLQSPDLLEQASAFDSFTDIAFNPAKSLNCQARAVALCISLRSRGVSPEQWHDQPAFLEAIGSEPCTRESRGGHLWDDSN
jgi:hypothetical protein